GLAERASRDRSSSVAFSPDGRALALAPARRAAAPMAPVRAAQAHRGVSGPNQQVAPAQGALGGAVPALRQAAATQEAAPQSGRAVGLFGAGQDRKVEVLQEAETRLAAEAYAPIVDNPFQSVSRDRQSTFSIDVDTGSYSNVRRFLSQNTLPPKDAVRIEEMLNYFP